MTSTPPPTGNTANANAATATPTSAPTNPPAGNASSTTPAPPSSAHKRRPYEDPTDGERYQLYVHSRAHPELKQKDLVTWFASSFGKEINQSTVSRALKRYRDNPPENPEVAGAAKSKRGGGAGGNAATASPATGGTANKRRKTGGAPGAAAGTVVGGASGAGEVEEEAASEQVQRENQQGRANGAGKVDASQQGESETVHVLPYQHPVQPLQPRGRGAAAAAQQAQHHHHSLPQQQLQHVLPHPPIAPHHQNAPQAPMAGAFPPQHVPNSHVPHLNNHVNHPPYPTGAPAPQMEMDSDSDSDVEGNAMTNGNGTYDVNVDTSFTSDDAELAALHRRYEAILLRSVLASGGAPGMTLPPELPQLGGEGASTDGPSAEGGENGSGPNPPTLSRESLVMYVVGRNELVRNLQGRITGMEREVARLRRKVQRREEVIRRLQGGQGQA